jgi:hypothetical protein
MAQLTVPKFSTLALVQPLEPQKSIDFMVFNRLARLASPKLKAGCRNRTNNQNNQQKKDYEIDNISTPGCGLAGLWPLA